MEPTKNVEKGAETDPSRSELWIYATGLVCASVCTSLPAEEVAEAVNRDRTFPEESGLLWVLSSDETFAGGEPNPCVCPDHPGTHNHYLLNC